MLLTKNGIQKRSFHIIRTRVIFVEDFHIDTGVRPSSLAVIYPPNAPSKFLPSYISLKHIGLRYAKERSSDDGDE